MPKTAKFHTTNHGPTLLKRDAGFGSSDRRYKPALAIALDDDAAEFTAIGAAELLAEGFVCTALAGLEDEAFWWSAGCALCAVVAVSGCELR
mgnify:CR=1 FL=1